MKKSDLTRLAKEFTQSMVIGFFVAYALVATYDMFFDGIPAEEREAGGRFALFALFLFYLWPLCSLTMLLVSWLLERFWSKSKYIVLQAIFTVSLIVSATYIFSR